MKDKIQQEPNPFALEKKYGPLLILSYVPQDPAERQAMGDLLGDAVRIRFEETVSHDDQALWEKWKKRAHPSPDESSNIQRLVRDFDHFLLGQFEHWGSRLFWSRVVLDRLLVWEQHRPDLFRRMGEALELKSQIVRGEKKAPIPHDMRKMNEKVYPELRVLFRTLKSNFQRRLRLPTALEVANWVKEEIDPRHQVYEHLWADLPQLLGFIKVLDNVNAGGLTRLVDGKFPPKEFLYHWLAWAMGRTYESVRQETWKQRPR